MLQSNRIAGSTLLTSHDPRPPPHRVVPVTPSRVCLDDHGRLRARHVPQRMPSIPRRGIACVRKATFANKTKKRAGRAWVPSGAEWRRPPHHRTLGRALAPLPLRPGAMALARPTTAHSAPRLVVRPRPRALCTTPPAHPQPSTRHALLGEAALAAPPQPVRPAAAQSAAAVSVCRGTRAASGSQRCSSRTACQCRGRSRGCRSSRSRR